MNLTWKPEEADMQECQNIFNDLGPENALFMSHYELASNTTIPAQQWKKFLSHPTVSDYLNQEIDMFRESQLRKLIQSSATRANSPGASAMINVLQKGKTGATGDDNVVTVYTYVPLNREESNAPNVREESHDIFWENE